MSLDAQTLYSLEYQQARRAASLAMVPPDRKEAALCVQRIDDILDRRPRPIAVAGDGEIVYDDQSPWVLAQAVQTAVNDTGKPEHVLTQAEIEAEFQRLRGGLA